MLGPRDRRYVSVLLPVGIVAAVALDMVVFGAFGFGHPGVPGSGACVCPPPAPLLLGAANESAANDSFEWPVQYAAPGLLAGDLTLQLLNSTGKPVGPGPSIALRNGSRTLAAYYLSGQQWVSGANVPVSPGETLVLTDPNPYTLLWDSLRVTTDGTTSSYPIEAGASYGPPPVVAAPAECRRPPAPPTADFSRAGVK